MNSEAQSNPDLPPNPPVGSRADSPANPAPALPAQAGLSATDAERFMRLFLIHERQIHGFILGLLPNQADAEDVLQNVCTVLWRKFQTFQTGTRFNSWAMKIAHFEVLKFYESKRGGQVQFNNDLLDQISDELVSVVERADDRHPKSEPHRG